MTYGSLDLQQALDWSHPDAYGLQALWFACPDTMQGTQRWLDLVAQAPAALTNMAWPPTLTSGWGVGRHSPALQFDGTNDYATVPTSPRFSLTGDITVMAWMRLATTTPTGATFRCILSKNNSAATFWNWEFGWDRTSKRLIGYADGLTPTTASSASATINDLNWHHVAYIRSGATLFFGIDGRVVASTAWSGAFNNNTYDLYMGYDLFSTTYFQGSLNDVRLYNYAVPVSSLMAMYQESFQGNPTLVQWDLPAEEAEWWVQAGGPLTQTLSGALASSGALPRGSGKGLYGAV